MNVTIKRLALDQLEPRVRNPNSMSDEQFKLLTAAIKKSGMLQPLLVRYPSERGEPISGRDGRGADPYQIVDGVHRWKASRAAGLKEVDCVVVDSDEAEAAVLQIGMNRMRGELDLRGVAVILGDLKAEGWSEREMTLTGFDLGEVKDLLQTLDAVNPDELPRGPVGGAADDDPRPEKAEADSYVLEIPFAKKKDMQDAKRQLKKAGGGDLALGLLAILAKDE